FLFILPPPLRSTLFPYTTLFRSETPWDEYPRTPSSKWSVRDAPARVLASGVGKVPREGRCSRKARQAGALADLCYKLSILSSLRSEERRVGKECRSR